MYLIGAFYFVQCQ